MKPQLWIVDLDRTLFDTSKFLHDITTVLEHHFKLDPQLILDTMPNYIAASELGYNFFSHANSLTGQSEAAIAQLITTQLTGHTYVFDDVAPWLATRDTNQILTIATVGHPNFQQLKLSLTPQLSPFKPRIVSEDKGAILASELKTVNGGYQCGFAQGTYAGITLVDDNPTTFFALGPQPGVRQILISRPDQRYTNADAPDHVERVTLLKDIV